MLIRIFRLSNKIGLVIIDLAQNSLRALWRAIVNFIPSVAKTGLRSQSRRSADRVVSLSGLAVSLLAVMALITYWATSGQAGGAVIRLLAVGGTPQPQSNAPGIFIPQQSVGQPTPDIPSVENKQGLIIYAAYSGSQLDLYAISGASTEPTRITHHTADDRDPAISPDGSRVAFSSRRDGNWEIYVMALTTGEVTRLTYDLAYEGFPSWSPDGQWLAYEAYYNGNLDIFIMKADGTDGPLQITTSPGADFSPSWGAYDSGSRGRLAYVAQNGTTQDIFVMSLDAPSESSAINVTNTPGISEDRPRWNPTGDALVYNGRENGIKLVYAASETEGGWQPSTVGQGHSPIWGASSSGEIYYISDRVDTSLFVTAQISSFTASNNVYTLSSKAVALDWSDGSLPRNLQGEIAVSASTPIEKAFTEEVAPAASDGSSPPYRLVNLQQYGLVASYPHLSDQVDSSFSSMRAYVNSQAGWDFLGQLDSVMWGLEQRPAPGQEFMNWHKAGRAIDIAQTYNFTDPPQIEIVPEQIGAELYWRIYVRTAIQDGSQGEPLKSVPWDFSARNTGSDVEAYENGGKLKASIPGGYFVDFTSIASLYGWYPVPADNSWRSVWTGVLYWQYENRGGLDWEAAMLELYSSEDLASVLNN